MKHIHRTSDGAYEVTLYNDQGVPIVYTIDDSVLENGARGNDGRQGWMTLYEAALIQAGVLKENGHYTNEYSADVIHDITHAVTGRDGQSFQPGADGSPSYQELCKLVRDGRPVTLGTVNATVPDEQARKLGVTPLQLAEQHQYMVDKVNPDGSLTLVNPWGADAHYGSASGAARITVSAKQYELYFDNVMVSADKSEWRQDRNAPDDYVIA
jgi:hypothetical protein